MKKLLFGNECIEKLRKGANVISDAVSSTMGPKGRFVIFEDQFGGPAVTKDGVTVAENISLSDQFENLGANMIKTAARQTVMKAGDGTTTATVLARDILNSGLKYIANGSSPVDLKRGIDRAVEEVVKHIRGKAIILDKSSEQIRQIATISGNNDPYIGDNVYKAFSLINEEGNVIVERSPINDTYVEKVNGSKFNTGYINQAFVNNRRTNEVELKNAYVLITNSELSSEKDIAKICKRIDSELKTNKYSLLVVAIDVDNMAFQFLLQNHYNGILPSCAVRGNASFTTRYDMMQDVAAITGGEVVSDEEGITLGNMDLSKLGKAETVVVGKDYMIITNGKGDKENVKKMADDLRKRIDTEKSDTEKSILKKRIANIYAGTSIIKVHGNNPQEIKEREDRFDDSINAVRSAIEEGIVPGSGIAYLQALKSIDSLILENEDRQMGVNIIKKALYSPIRTIVENAGGSPDVIIEKVLRGDENYGYDLNSNEYGNLIELGVIDPGKVLCVALENAASASTHMLMTNAGVVNDIDEILKRKNAWKTE